MWEPYVQSVEACVPQADRKIVFDVFHILRHMNEPVDQVRRQEHRLLRAQGDDTMTGSKYVWLYGEENAPDHHQERFTELTRRRSRKKLKTAPAWALKESLRICGGAGPAARPGSGGAGGTAGHRARGSNRSSRWRG